MILHKAGRVWVSIVAESRVNRLFGSADCCNALSERPLNCAAEVELGRFVRGVDCYRTESESTHLLWSGFVTQGKEFVLDDDDVIRFLVRTRASDYCLMRQDTWGVDRIAALNERTDW
jgi:hypothetical protein